MVVLQQRNLLSLQQQRVSTGCPQLDEVLGGGLPCGSLTEVTGEAAVSKTQLCLQLLLSVQLAQQYGGLGGAAVYVYTEGEPATRRLHQLAQGLPLRYPPEALAGLADPTANIFVEKGISTGSELLARLQRLRGLLDQQRRRAAAASAAAAAACAGAAGAPAGTSTRPVRLLVVDSVAHVCRDMGDHVGVGELAGRTQLLFKVSALLRRYADEYGLAVLLVNQVMDSVDHSVHSSSAAPPPAAAAAAPRAAAVKNTGHTGGMRLMSLGREVVPALGLAWANCINTRIFLSRCGTSAASPALFYGSPSAAAAAAAEATAAGPGSTSSGGGGGGVLAPALRKMQVVFSPSLPQGECFYVVDATGLRGLLPEELEQHHSAQAAAEAAAARQQLLWEQEQQRQAWEQEQRQRAHHQPQHPQQGPQQHWQGTAPQWGGQQQQQQQQQQAGGRQGPPPGQQRGWQQQAPHQPGSWQPAACQTHSTEGGWQFKQQHQQRQPFQQQQQQPQQFHNPHQPGW